MFLRVAKEKAIGTGHHFNTIVTTGEKLIEALDEPEKGDGYKVSMEWVFIDIDTKEIFTLYDYKETSLYSPDLPSPEALKQIPIEFHIGSNATEGEERFKQFVLEALK